ncbi:MAG: SDR family oxidoreductase, partial [Actinomycetota bacterium]|nr:SDR family oxidoreductase [Actinomycetota bacterium]
MSERVVVVTGAASGIGFATAERFRDLGDTVFGLDIAPTVPEGVTYVECNVGSKAAVDAAIATCAASGRIDVLANVAGVVQFGRFEGVTEEVFDRTLDIDLKGPFFLMQAALPHLRAAGGNIVNVSSVAGRIPQPYSAAYSAAKGGLTQLTKALALELSPEGIRVNAVCPGTVATPLVDGVAASYPADLDARVQDRLLMMLPGAAITPDEIASSIVYLASAEARMITGS